MSKIGNFLINYGRNQGLLLLFDSPIWVFILISLALSIVFVALSNSRIYV
ncbi:hypothetical protein HYE16_03450 [Mycoplasmopsis bovis]|nr:hypothetical protein [Mycoplasmopsis bovis]QQH26677.1 hypothetical protein HYE10_03145 [Mycoplasmopsis bovis]QQH35977.1 hypothetical protein HYD90_03190 [Mycoplasmopsis bovis]QUE42175.1 hypothetical protein HYE16_03450 [Mycoplasmopsis bovis]QUE42473.1 hypothetical protein HYE06_03450 [Mycoplasmopsis bovis]QUE42759.1 hypothetical protein HYD95_03465 [Mycoplasmopsis bovis]